MKTLAPEKVPPSPDAPEDRSDRDPWLILKVASGLIEAQLIQGMLRQSEIETLLEGFDRSPSAFLNPFGDIQAPTRVWVRRRHYEEASLLLSEVDAAPLVASESRGVRGWILMMLAISAVVVLLVFLEIFGFAPCSIGVLCL